MDFKWLRTFMLAAEKLNYRKVSEMLYITQPAVSLHIKQLEEHLGEKLFYKRGRNIHLTKFGSLFLTEASHLLNEYEGMLQRVNRHQQGHLVTLSIAMSPLLVESVFPTILRRFTDAHPEIELSITVAESADLSDMVEQEDVDLALSCSSSTAKEVVSKKIVADSISLVTLHDGSDMESALPIDACELLASSVIFTDHHPGYWDQLKLDLKRHTPSCKFLKVTQSHAAKRFILEGMGVSFLPSFVTRREIKEGRMITVDTPFLHLPEAKIFALYLAVPEHSFRDKLLLYLNGFM